MSKKRLIVCLDVKNGRVVKGVNFENISDVGDPVELADFYDKQGADEIVFLDISATIEGRKTTLDMVKKVAKNVKVPFTVGGGISTFKDMENLLTSGADKVSISTAAVKNPELIREGARRLGSKHIVLACDTKKSNSGWEVYTHGGRVASRLDTIEWCKKAADLGAGEVLLTSMDADGTKDGYDVELTRAVAEAVQIPVIASGGAGKLEHFKDVFLKGKASGALAASIFHRGLLSVKEVKEYLISEGVGIIDD
ncbi:MAG TPA: imidazole glycerol phosphate synthase subunit HisF [Thermoanaerobacterales bacterium]|jgi:cyclase|nr:imidazole glycerol phosphate synthase subunit HisF [Thermoanaerobacterales bacterium]